MRNNDEIKNKDDTQEVEEILEKIGSENAFSDVIYDILFDSVLDNNVEKLKTYSQLIGEKDWEKYLYHNHSMVFDMLFEKQICPYCLTRLKFKQYEDMHGSVCEPWLTEITKEAYCPNMCI